MFRALIEQIRVVLDEEAKRPLPWNRPSPQALKDNERKLRAIGMTTDKKRKVIARGPFDAPERPIVTGRPPTS